MMDDERRRCGTCVVCCGESEPGDGSSGCESVIRWDNGVDRGIDARQKLPPLRSWRIGCEWRWELNEQDSQRNNGV